MKTIRAIKSATGASVTNDREIANILNKHFATTGEKLAGLLNSHYVPTVELIDRISPTVTEIEIQEENVKENLLRLNSLITSSSKQITEMIGEQTEHSPN